MRWDNVPALLRELLVIGSPVLLLLWRERRSCQAVPDISRSKSQRADKAVDVEMAVEMSRL
jgi:hypothetical protein